MRRGCMAIMGRGYCQKECNGKKKKEMEKISKQGNKLKTQLNIEGLVRPSLAKNLPGV